METFTNKKLEFFLLKVFVLTHVVVKYFAILHEHLHLQPIHLQLEIKVFDGVIMTAHLDASVITISRRWNLLVEALLDTRMIPSPVLVLRRFVWIALSILVRP